MFTRKYPTTRIASLVLIAGAAWLVTGAMSEAANPLGLLPSPKHLEVGGGGDMPITAQSRIVVADPKLKPSAEILSEEILLATRLKLAPVEGEVRPGDIVLKLNPQLRADADILRWETATARSMRVTPSNPGTWKN